MKVSKKYLVRIIGSLLVYWNKSRAKELEIENLEFGLNFVDICWTGIRGKKQESVFDEILNFA